MSAIPLKAEIGSAKWNVRFGPGTDIVRDIIYKKSRGLWPRFGAEGNHGTNGLLPLRLTSSHRDG
jgi:hypothetical protein